MSLAPGESGVFPLAGRNWPCIAQFQWEIFQEYTGPRIEGWCVEVQRANGVANGGYSAKFTVFDAMITSQWMSATGDYLDQYLPQSTLELIAKLTELRVFSSHHAPGAFHQNLDLGPLTGAGAKVWEGMRSRGKAEYDSSLGRYRLV